MLDLGLGLTRMESLCLILVCCDLQKKRKCCVRIQLLRTYNCSLQIRSALTSTRRSFLTFAARSTFLGDDWLGILLCSRHNSEPRSLSHQNNNLHLFKMYKTESLCTWTLDSLASDVVDGWWKHTPRRGAITKPVLGTASAFKGVGVTIIALAGPGKGARKVNRQ